MKNLLDCYIICLECLQILIKKTYWQCNICHNVRERDKVITAKMTDICEKQKEADRKNTLKWVGGFSVGIGLGHLRSTITITKKKVLSLWNSDFIWPLKKIPLKRILEDYGFAPHSALGFLKTARKNLSLNYIFTFNLMVNLLTAFINLSGT